MLLQSRGGEGGGSGGKEGGGDGGGGSGGGGEGGGGGNEGGGEHWNWVAECVHPRTPAAGNVDSTHSRTYRPPLIV